MRRQGSTATLPRFMCMRTFLNLNLNLNLSLNMTININVHLCLASACGRVVLVPALRLTVLAICVSEYLASSQQRRPA